VSLSDQGLVQVMMPAVPERDAERLQVLRSRTCIAVICADLPDKAAFIPSALFSRKARIVRKPTNKAGATSTHVQPH